MPPEHHHAHGPANRGRVVLTTAAPLFVCEPSGAPRAAVIALHGRHGITAAFERGLRAVAVHGYLAAAPFHYFRDGGPEYVTASSARDAYAALSEADIDADVDAALDHLGGRLGLRVAAVLGSEFVAPAVKRAGERHPDLVAVTLPDPDPDRATGDASPAEWLAAVEHLGCVTAGWTHA
jgi:carboxymethylenebutenolidase